MVCVITLLDKIQKYLYICTLVHVSVCVCMAIFVQKQDIYMTYQDEIPFVVGMFRALPKHRMISQGARMESVVNTHE